MTPGHREQADVGIAGGRIAQIGGTMTGAEEIDADGLLVIPGGIDAHVHLMCAAAGRPGGRRAAGEPVWVDDFWTGSRAAIAGGITTVGNMTFALPGESMTQAVARDMAGARAEAAVDWFLHPVLTGLGDGRAAEVAALAADGHTSVKVFLSDPGFAAGTPGLAEVDRRGRPGRVAHPRALRGRADAGADRPGADRGRARRGPPLPRRPDGQTPRSRPSTQAVSLAARHRLRPSTSCTCPAPPPWTAAARPAPPGCPSTSRPGRCTCT